jgi:hypothetical protein
VCFDGIAKDAATLNAPNDISSRLGFGQIKRVIDFLKLHRASWRSAV